MTEQISPESQHDLPDAELTLQKAVSSGPVNVEHSTRYEDLTTVFDEWKSFVCPGFKSRSPTVFCIESLLASPLQAFPSETSDPT
jgi:hypothetical protein